MENISKERLQELIDEGDISTKDQLVLMKENKFQVKYKLLLEELNYHDVDHLIKSDTNVSFVIGNREKSRELLNTFYEKAPYHFVRDDEFTRKQFIKKISGEDTKYTRKTNTQEVEDFSEDFVLKAIEEGEFDYKDKYVGDNMLMWAAYQNKYDLVKELLNYIDVNSTSNSGYTALMKASIEGYPNIVRLLIENGADVNLVNRGGESALIEAVKSGNVETVKILLDNGANVNQLKNNGQTALSEALERGNKEIKDLLLSKGAKLSGYRRSNNYDYENRNGLHYVVSQNEGTELSKILIKAGIKPI